MCNCKCSAWFLLLIYKHSNTHTQKIQITIDVKIKWNYWIEQANMCEIVLVIPSFANINVSVNLLSICFVTYLSLGARVRVLFPFQFRVCAAQFHSIDFVQFNVVKPKENETKKNWQLNLVNWSKWIENNKILKIVLNRRKNQTILYWLISSLINGKIIAKQIDASDDSMILWTHRKFIRIVSSFILIIEMNAMRMRAMKFYLNGTRNQFVFISQWFVCFRMMNEIMNWQNY